MKIRSIHRVVIILSAALFLVSTCVGCRNTAHGFGQDVERTGEKIQEKTD